MALFVRYEPAIHSFLTSLLANLEDAEVVMQETRIAMWRKCDRFDKGTSFRNWAFRMARFEAMNFRRKRQRDRHFFSDELVQLPADAAARHAARLEEQRRVLAHCVAKLDSRDRGLLSGCYREGATMTECNGALQWTGDGGRVVRDLPAGSPRLPMPSRSPMRKGPIAGSPTRAGRTTKPRSSTTPTPRSTSTMWGWDDRQGLDRRRRLPLSPL